MDRILGLDCGWVRPGAAIISFDFETNRPPQLVHAESFHTVGLSKAKRRQKGVTLVYKSVDDARRMVEISDWITSLVFEFSPTLAVLELPSAGGKSSNAVKGMAIGSSVAVTTFRRLNVAQSYITPQQNKAGATGDREAKKEAMLAAARQLFPDFAWPAKKRGGLDKEKAWAIADAIACVTTWKTTKESREKLAESRWE